MSFPVVIHHNPACGTSRNVLAIVRAAGYEPVVIAYLETGWTRPQLQALFAAAGLSARQALREKEWRADQDGPLTDDMQDERILEAMLKRPVLVNRPIVATPKGVRLCRPSEAVLSLLERMPAGPLAKEDGSLIIDAKGRLVAAPAAP